MTQTQVLLKHKDAMIQWFTAVNVEHLPIYANTKFILLRKKNIQAVLMLCYDADTNFYIFFLVKVSSNRNNNNKKDGTAMWKKV